MGKTFVNQTSFASGEISPMLFGRIDRDVYYNGASQLRNVSVTPLGGVIRRPGFEYIANTYNDTKSRLISFQFSRSQVYLFVLTPQRITIYRDDAVVATLTTGFITDLTADIIEELNFTQSLDNLLIFHPDLKPIKIVRRSDSVWDVERIAFKNIPTWDFGEVETDGTIAPSAKEGDSITLTASENVFTPAMVNGWAVRMNNGYAYITAYSSATSVTARTIRPFEDTGAVSEWTIEEPVWSDDRGYPVAATFWQSRLWIGGSKSRPQTVWGSLIAGFFDFDFRDGESADAIEWTADDDQVNKIQNIFGGRTLQVFSESAEYFSPINIDRTVTPDAFALERATRMGSSSPTPVSSDGATVFLGYSGNVVHEFIYLEVEQSYIAEDISYLSEHLIRKPTRIALQKASSFLPSEYTYFLNEDGTIAVLNRKRSQNFISWTLWETGGEFEDITVVGNDVYVAVKRHIDNKDVRFIEKLNPDRFSDASKILTDAPATTQWDTLDYLEGERVSVRAGEGFPLLFNEVSSGEITTEIKQESIEVGLPFTVTIKSLPPEAPQRAGSLIGERRRIVSCALNLNNSDSFSLSTEKNTYRVTLTSFGDVTLNQPLELFTGWKRIPIRGFSREPYILIEQERPVNFQLLSMKLEVTT